MTLLSNYWQFQTLIFTAIFLAVVFISTRPKSDGSPMSKETSNELRGLAILGILFAHLTYGKFYGTDFLFPLGIWAGPAVDLFFFLSGYGLAASAIFHPKPVSEFFRKRIIKIYLPLWIFLAAVLSADFFILQRTYPWQESLSAFLGFYPEANLFTSINSPLWFLTPLLFYYLLFPFIFRPKHPRWSLLMIFAVSYLAFMPGLPVHLQIVQYYQSHWLAFPLGALFAVLVVSPQAVCRLCSRKAGCRAYRWLLSAWAKDDAQTSRPVAAALAGAQKLPAFWRWLLLAVLAGLAWQTAYHSGVGKGLWIEQAYALFTMLCLVLLFALKKTKSDFLALVGAYSFEIYLWHWPLIGRYDMLYRVLPPWLATALYLPLLLLVAYSFNRLATWAEAAIAGQKKIPG